MTDIGIPDQIGQIVGSLLLLLVGFALLWLALSLVQRFHQRAYNLSKAESAGAAVKPDFLSTDHAKRESALARGRAFDEQREAKAHAIAPACRMARLAVIVTALLSFISAAAGALLKIDSIQNAYNQLSSWERFVTIVGAYKIGFAVAAVAILISAMQLVHSLRARGS